MNELMQKLYEAGPVNSIEIISNISEYDKNFILMEFTGKRTYDYYIKRLDLLGFNGMNYVLDAACGMGQWSLALAKNNKFVEGIDINLNRITMAQILSKENNIVNCRFINDSIEKLPYDSEVFDGIFCYGSFMFVNMPKTLLEFNRVLKKNGKLYLNANSYGWYLHLLLDLGLKKGNLNLINSAIKILLRTIIGRNNNIIVRKNWLKNIIENAGFEINSIDVEGMINNHGYFVESAYPSHFYGMKSILEVLAIKR